MDKNLKELTVLVVDDDTGVRKYIAAALSEYGYKTIEASSAYEGLNIFQKVTTDVVITDIYMPNMNGFELIQRLRELKSGVKILAMTGDPRRDENYSLDWAKAAGATAVIEKPFTPGDLAGKLDMIFAQ